MISRRNWDKILIVIMLSVATAITSRAQNLKTLIIFDGTDGATPVDTPFVQGTNGNLYGTTLGGGAYGLGTFFEITSAGKLTTLYSFCSQLNCADGSGPYGGLVLGRDGNFYGTTDTGGADGSGTIFRTAPGGTLTTLHSFNGADGAGSVSPMILGTDGSFYGITLNGGTSNSGTIFKITPSGSFTTLHSFGPGDGSFANGPLVQGADGNFYGTTEIGGTNGVGSIFKVTPSGTFSTFHSFDSSDGSAPACGLLLAADGNFYGTTYEGGSSNHCPNGCGTVFKITRAGTLTTLHNFDSTEGANPIAGLIQATDGNFYGTTYAGGTGGDWGTVFEITPSGTVTTLHSFQGTDGAQPYGPVTQATNGSFYGTATNGTSSASQGTVFGVFTALEPFVSLVTSTGRIGESIGILGQGFTGTTRVSFNGTSSSFTVKSGTFITATVPVGATTGFVQVTTTSGTLKSNVPFRVLQ